jgi:hypothetical protein
MRAQLPTPGASDCIAATELRFARALSLGFAAKLPKDLALISSLQHGAPGQKRSDRE